MSLNAKKTKDMWICFMKSIQEPPKLTIDDRESKVFQVTGRLPSE